MSGLIVRRLALVSTVIDAAGFWACTEGASPAADTSPADNNAKTESRTGQPPGPVRDTNLRPILESHSLGPKTTNVDGDGPREGKSTRSLRVRGSRSL